MVSEQLRMQLHVFGLWSVFNSDGGLHVSHEPMLPLHASISNSQDDATSLRCQLAKTVPLLQPLVKLGPGYQVCEHMVCLG